MEKRFFSWFSRRFEETPETIVFPEGTTTTLFAPTADSRPRVSSRQQTRILCGPPPCDLSVMSSSQTAVGAVGAVSAAVGGSSAAVPATSMTAVGD